MWLFGGLYFGHTALSQPVLNDMWRLDVDESAASPSVTWHRVSSDDHSPEHAGPDARAEAAMFNMPGGDAIVLGGQGWCVSPGCHNRLFRHGLPAVQKHYPAARHYPVTPVASDTAAPFSLRRTLGDGGADTNATGLLVSDAWLREPAAAAAPAIDEAAATVKAAAGH